jgi:hypothetical protein
MPKDDGKPRIRVNPMVKDLIVQLALLFLLQPVCEADFPQPATATGRARAPIRHARRFAQPLGKGTQPQRFNGS